MSSDDDNGEGERVFQVSSEALLDSTVVIRALYEVLGELKEPKLDRQTLEMWRANGFMLGEISHQNLPRWLARLPRPLSTSVLSILGKDRFTPVTLNENKSRSAPISVIGLDGDEHAQRFRRGRYQVLLRLIRESCGKGYELEVLPHHYEARQALLPRAEEEKVFDGTSFNDLRFKLPIPPDRVYVIWPSFALPPESTLAMSDEGESDVAAGADVEMMHVAVEEKRQTRWSLAEAMMMGKISGRETMTIIMVAANP